MSDINPINRNFGVLILFLLLIKSEYIGNNETSAIFFVGILLFDAIKTIGQSNEGGK